MESDHQKDGTQRSAQRPVQGLLYVVGDQVGNQQAIITTDQCRGDVVANGKNEHEKCACGNANPLMLSTGWPSFSATPMSRM